MKAEVKENQRREIFFRRVVFTIRIQLRLKPSLQRCSHRSLQFRYSLLHQIKRAVAIEVESQKQGLQLFVVLDVIDFFSSRAR